METRLLVLGAGRHQKGLIQRAEARGVRVVVSDYYADSPGKRFATYPTMTDTMDIEANISLAREHGVAGVITTGTDQAVVTMAAVASALDLPCYLSPDAALRATDKQQMKAAYREAGIPTARHVEVSADRPTPGDALTCPVVVKPSDSQGQRGTRRVQDPADLAHAVSAALAVSRSGTAVVEEFIDGYEITVSAWAEAGEPRLVLVADRVTFNPLPAIGICFQHITPSRHAEGKHDRLREIVAGIMRAYGVTSGPLYVQLLVRGDELFVVEGACRVGGGHEASLIPMVTGIDVIDRLIDLALTGQCDPITEIRDDKHALVNFLFARPGVIQAQRGMDDAIAGGVAECGEFYHPIGYHCPGVTDAQGRVGYFISRDASRAALLDRARRCYDGLELVDQAGNGLLFWPSPDQVIG